MKNLDKPTIGKLVAIGIAVVIAVAAVFGVEVGDIPVF